MKYLVSLLLLFSAISCKNLKKEDSPDKSITEQKYDSVKKLIEILSDNISSNDTCYKCYLTRGIVYKITRQYAEAIKDFSSAISINKNKWVGFADRGAMYYLIDDYENALKDFLSAYQLDTTNKKLCNRISHMLFATGKKDEACKYYFMSLDAGFPKNEFDSSIVDYCNCNDF